MLIQNKHVFLKTLFLEKGTEAVAQLSKKLVQSIPITIFQGVQAAGTIEYIQL